MQEGCGQKEDIASARTAFLTCPRMRNILPLTIHWSELVIFKGTWKFGEQNDFCHIVPNFLGKSAIHTLIDEKNYAPWHRYGASQVALVVKNLPANAGDVREAGSIPGLGRFPGEGNGDLLQYCCLENSMYRGAWQATDHGATKSQT